MGLRILIAEPDAPLRQRIARALDGHTVIEAAGGAAALRALNGDPVCLLITSLEPGEVDASTLMEQLRAREPRALAIVTLHASRAGHAPLLLRRGAYDCLIHPCDDDVLEAVLRRAVGRLSLLQENQALLDSLKRNVEALGRQNEQLKELATRDGLTGLFNHRYFREQLEVELSRCRRYGRVLSLVFADIDHFKKYNDSYGHLAGDRLLSTVGQLITSQSRQSTVVARYGGEEFVLLVPESDHPAALAYAEKVRRLVDEHVFDAGADHTPGRITLSLGVATFPEDGTEADALIKCADDALYRAKDSGRNAVCGRPGVEPASLTATAP